MGEVYYVLNTQCRWICVTIPVLTESRHTCFEASKLLTGQKKKNIFSASFYFKL